jgi:hypothetical protein
MHMLVRAVWPCSRCGHNKLFLRFIVSFKDCIGSTEEVRVGAQISVSYQFLSYNWVAFLKGSRRRPTMRTKLIMLSVAAALITIGGAAFEAKATMGGSESLSKQATPYSLIERASCNGQGMFCHAGSALQCKPICVCVPCFSPSPVRVKHHKHTG